MKDTKYLERWRAWYAACVVSSCAFDGGPAASSDTREPSTTPHRNTHAMNSVSAGSSQVAPDVASALKAAVANTRELRDRALSETLERWFLQAALAKDPSDEEVAGYYNQYLDRFVKPEAIEVWRILTGSREHAMELLNRVKNSESPQKTWSLIAREHSLDKATHFRKGYLGFVRADGTTDVPQVRVSPAIYAAAKPLEDNAYLEEPVREGDNWALIWRRGYRAEERTTLEQARRDITYQLALAKARVQLNDLLAELRKTHSSEHHPELLEALPTTHEEGTAVPRRPAQPHPADRQPTPRKTDWGER